MLGLVINNYICTLKMCFWDFVLMISVFKTCFIEESARAMTRSMGSP